jgi:hypothetical protein
MNRREFLSTAGLLGIVLPFAKDVVGAPTADKWAHVVTDPKFAGTYSVRIRRIRNSTGARSIVSPITIPVPDKYVL